MHSGSLWQCLQSSCTPKDQYSHDYIHPNSPGEQNRQETSATHIQGLHVAILKTDKRVQSMLNDGWRPQGAGAAYGEAFSYVVSRSSHQDPEPTLDIHQTKLQHCLQGLQDFQHGLYKLVRVNWGFVHAWRCHGSCTQFCARLCFPRNCDSWIIDTCKHISASGWAHRHYLFSIDWSSFQSGHMFVYLASRWFELACMCTLLLQHGTTSPAPTCLLNRANSCKLCMSCVWQT